METITIVLFLLLAVVVSGVLSRAIPVSLPRPLFQIALGGLIGLVADWRVTLDPEIFFLLFLPPLLFLDGWRIPRDELFRDARTVLGLALGLVIVTVLGMGFFIHWLIPAMPLAVAFALAAIVSPTDPIAVSAIAQRTPIPGRMMHILEGESLLNDASGLVCFRFSVAAALTGGFVLGDAALSFLWVALGGLAVGVGITWAVSRAKTWVARRYGEDGGTQILVSLLIPFGSYLVAEHLHCSGILAAVAAGVTMGFVETSGELAAATRIRRSTVWDMIQFAASGVIFVLLGEQLPLILRGAAETVYSSGHYQTWWLGIYIVAIMSGLVLMRFAWVWLSLKLTLARGAKAVAAPWRIVAAMSFAGVRGAITLAGVLTLPLTLGDGSPFPARDLAIFLAMGVIVASLLIASVALPPLLRGLRMPAEPSRMAEEDAARIAAAQAAIRAIAETEHQMPADHPDADLYMATGARLLDLYHDRIERRQGEPDDRASDRRAEKIERNLRLVALKAERAEVFRMVRKRMLGGATARRLIRELDLLEARYAG
ncbi:Na+/H+ antiporter [Sphingomonas sp.]|uniref:Na+/H+ antiporter n=1 Tax=Sphingomonas sp. TaxID=28214 RepID=UPI003B3A2BD4